MTIIEQIKAEIDKKYAEYREKMKTDDFTYYEGMADALDLFEQFIDTLESEKPMKMEEAVKWLVDDDYHEASEKGRFILGSVGLGYNGYYIPYLDLLKLPKED